MMIILSQVFGTFVLFENLLVRSVRKNIWGADIVKVSERICQQPLHQLIEDMLKYGRRT
jgi:hypothetical protein